MYSDLSLSALGMEMIQFFFFNSAPKPVVPRPLQGVDHQLSRTVHTEYTVYTCIHMYTVLYSIYSVLYSTVQFSQTDMDYLSRTNAIGFSAGEMP